jgi:hypothetical protein
VTAEGELTAETEVGTLTSNSNLCPRKTSNPPTDNLRSFSEFDVEYWRLSVERSVFDVDLCDLMFAPESAR